MYKLKLMKISRQEMQRRADKLVSEHFELLDKLIEIRKAKGLTQETVGIRMGITQPGVASFESDESNPTLSTIRRYALAIGADVEIEVRSLPGA
jgi:transcriptional regulator with XRE-family HTH domain